MLIIVEGPDGSGKSTFIKHLKQKIKCIEIPPVSRNYPNVFNICRELYDACSRSSNIYVMDRCYLSEWVYRIIKQDEWPNMIFQEIALLLEIPVVYIYCKNINSFDKAIERGENYITTEEEHKAITNAYDVVFKTIKMFNNSYVREYDYECDDIDNLLDDLQVDWEVNFIGVDS